MFDYSCIDCAHYNHELNRCNALIVNTTDKCSWKTPINPHISQKVFDVLYRYVPHSIDGATIYTNISCDRLPYGLDVLNITLFACRETVAFSTYIDEFNCDRLDVLLEPNIKDCVSKLIQIIKSKEYESHDKS
jgi:hypothetical protein